MTPRLLTAASGARLATVRSALSLVVASAGTWVLRLSPSLGDDAFSRALAWVQDQLLITWVALFLLASLVFGYWLRVLTGSEPRAQPATESGPRLGEWGKALGLVVLAGVLAIGARRYLFEVCKVRSTSMLPNLYPGDTTWVRKLGRAGTLPARGTAILLETPDPAVASSEPLLFKRVVGLPGDKLSVQGGLPTINGWRVPRCQLGRARLEFGSIDAPVEPTLFVEWLGDATYLTLMDGLSENAGPFQVLPGQVWVLGDHRNQSVDSRSWFQGLGGGVPVGSIRGSASMVLFNADSIAGRHFVRSERLELPPGAESLDSALARCLAQKPERTLPPDAVASRP